MRVPSYLAGLFGLFLLALWAAPAAQAQPAPPPGSYLRTCRDVRVPGGRDITALCETRQPGRFQATRLDDFRSCASDIANINGDLRCERRRPPPPPPVVGPPGSYQRTCNRLQFDRGILSAVCRTQNGEWRATSLNVSTCQPGADIANINGRLTCPPRAARRPPPGSYMRTCRNIHVGPIGTLRAECRTMNGAWVAAALPPDACRPGRDIANINGRLVCN